MSNELTFEKAITRLEQIVSKLEGGQCTLDESLKLFEEGTKLAAFCNKALKNAGQEITRLMSGKSGDTSGGEAADEGGHEQP